MNGVADSLSPCNELNDCSQDNIPWDQMMEAMKLTLEIPGEILTAIRLPPKEMEREFRKELALALYQWGALSLGKDRLLAQTTLWEFEEFVGQRKALRHFTESDLEEDIRYGLGGQ